MIKSEDTSKNIREKYKFSKYTFGAGIAYLLFIPVIRLMHNKKPTLVPPQAETTSFPVVIRINWRKYRN